MPALVHEARRNNETDGEGAVGNSEGNDDFSRENH
jgi:hypothetical protein